VLKISIENKWLDVQQFQPYSIMIPIPLHHVKQRERGFNQALVIAQELFRFIPIPIHTKKIKRVLWTNSQTKLNITERRANVHNAFYSDSKFIDENILLIDDVLTTGATSSACAYTLKQNGVNNIGIFTLATSKLDS
jgi:ComF family protein